MWRRGSCERSSRRGREELRKGDQLFIDRDRELAEMRSQLAELRTLFDEVCHQLYRGCKRIEGVQETVNACVKQTKELEAIHHKLEESHQMLTQMLVTRAWREDQDSEDPETRRTAYSSLSGRDAAFQGEVAESDVSDASHETGSCGHTGTRAGCRQTPECKHAMRLRVR